MKPIIFLALLLAHAMCVTLWAQHTNDGSNAIDNLVHRKGYKSGSYNAIPEYKKIGNGKISMVVIPGWGFDATVFYDFANAHKAKCTLYIVTIPGFGDTKAPPMPNEGASYGEYTWTKSAVEGIVSLIASKKLDKPIVVGHFITGTQVAIQLALEYPDKVGKLIIAGGDARFVLMWSGKAVEYSLKSRIAYADKELAEFYKKVSRDTWRENNIAPQVYRVKDEQDAMRLWKMNDAVSLPVMIRYLIEYQVMDQLMSIEELKCPMLVLRPELFKNSSDPAYILIKQRFYDAWDSMNKINDKVIIKDIPDSGIFVWKDQPKVVASLITDFITEK